MAGAVTSPCRSALCWPAAWLWLLVVAAPWPLQAWSLGAAAPFMPPQRPLANAEAADPAASAAGTSMAPAIGLAGVKLGAQPQALIDGQWWSRGSWVRGARLVMVSAGAVQLRHPDGRIEHLLLTPQVEWLRLQGRSTTVPTPSSARPTELR